MSLALAQNLVSSPRALHRRHTSREEHRLEWEEEKGEEEVEGRWERTMDRSSGGSAPMEVLLGGVDMLFWLVPREDWMVAMVRRMEARALLMTEKVLWMTAITILGSGICNNLAKDSRLAAVSSG